MIRKLTFALAATASAFSAAPVIAQDSTEQARTTYELRFIDLAPGAEGRWMELVDKYYAPARAAVGLPPINVHFMMTGDYDLLLPIVMPRGMAAFDSHSNPDGQALNKAFIQLAGGEENAKKIREEMGTLVERTKSVYSHTHP